MLTRMSFKIPSDLDFVQHLGVYHIPFRCRNTHIDGGWQRLAVREIFGTQVAPVVRRELGVVPVPGLGQIAPELSL